MNGGTSMKQTINTQGDRGAKKLEEIAIEMFHFVIDNGGTLSDYDKGMNYIKSHVTYTNKEIWDKIGRHCNRY